MTERQEKWKSLGLCPNCGARPPDPNRALCSVCLRTQRDLRRKHRAEDPEAGKDLYHLRKTSGICTHCGRGSARPGYTLCTECNTAERQRAVGIKQRVMLKYGGVCSCCGETHIAFLTLDHIHDDGHKRRGEGVGSGLYKKLLQLPVDPSLRVLCYNCNCGRRVTGECPHKDDSFHTEALGRKPYSRPQWEASEQLSLPFWSKTYTRDQERLSLLALEQEVLDYIQLHPWCLTSDVRHHVQLGSKPWSFLLGKLRLEGKVTTQGESRGMRILRS